MTLPPLATPIPPDELLYLVSGHADREPWARSRRAAVVDVIIPMLAAAGIDIATRKSILDFGCGCGRILAGWEGVLGQARLTGADINPKLVPFCQENIRFATVVQCGAYPPLPFPSGAFDFVYAASVFTHMKEQALHDWAAEMARVLEPGGALMISYHGGHYHRALPHTEFRRLCAEGVVVQLHGSAEETFEGSNRYATHMTSDYVKQLFAGFDLLRLRFGSEEGPTHFGAHQDIAVFRLN
jgi:SAM-dependent methyltransferase